MRPLFSILVGLLVLASRAAAQSAPEPVALVSEAMVRGELIYLADLLPENAGAELRGAAKTVYLAPAPPLGTERVLTGTEVSKALRDQGFKPLLVVPPKIVVHRSGRLVTREEVFRAILETLEFNHFPQSATLRSEDVNLAAPVVVHEQDPELEVVRMDLDPALHKLCFLFVSRRERTVLPFVATLRSEGDVTAFVRHEIRGQEAVARADVRKEVSAAAAKPSEKLRPQVLVTPGTLATLRVSDSEMQMLLKVDPLERGFEGQTIRVRLVPSGRVLRGRVVGPGHLEASF